MPCGDKFFEAAALDIHALVQTLAKFRKVHTRPIQRHKIGIENEMVLVDDFRGLEKFRIPFRLCTLELLGTAKDRKWTKAAKRTAADLHHAAAIEIQRLPGHRAADDGFLPQQQFHETDAASVLGRIDQFVGLPRRTAAQARQAVTQDAPAFARRQRQKIFELGHRLSYRLENSFRY